MEGFNQEFIRAFKEKTPPDINPVDLLTEIINVKKEAAYRRLRGEQPFSAEEMACIAVRLNISLDGLLGNKPMGVYYASFNPADQSDPFEFYYRTTANTVGWLEMIKSDPTLVKFSTCNTLPQTHLFDYPLLSKLRLFKYMYQTQKGAKPAKMADFVVPNRLLDIEQKVVRAYQQCKTIYIWSKDIISPFIEDIRYFASMGMLSAEEVAALKNEMGEMLAVLEQAAISGELATGAPFEVYITEMFMDANYIYVEGGGTTSCSFYVFGINFCSFLESDLTTSVREWIESLMKYSVLISRSGTAERVNFFRKQHSLLNAL